MRGSRFCAIVLIFVFLLLLGPYLILLLASFNEESILRFPPKGFTLHWYVKALRTPMFTNAFKTSLLVAVVSTVTGLVLGFPAAYGIARFPFTGREIVKTAFLSPAIVPGLVIGYALLRFFVLLGRLPVLIGLYLGHLTIVLPYTIRVVLASLQNLDPSIDDAAASLGASPLHVLMRVILPNVRSGIIAAFILAFITSFNDVSVSLFLTGPGVTLLPLQMLAYVEYYYDPTIAALSTLLIAATIILVQLAEKTLGLSKYF